MNNPIAIGNAAATVTNPPAVSCSLSARAMEFCPGAPWHLGEFEDDVNTFLAQHPFDGTSSNED